MCSTSSCMVSVRTYHQLSHTGDVRVSFLSLPTVHSFIASSIQKWRGEAWFVYDTNGRQRGNGVPD